MASLRTGGWRDYDEEDNSFTEITPLLVTQKRDQLSSPTTIESLDYDRCPNEPYMAFISTKTKAMVRYLNIKDWVMFCVIGITTGVVAFAIDMGVKYLSEVKFSTTFTFVSQYSSAIMIPLMIFVSFSLFYCLIAAAAVALTPEAAGSGIPEIKCYLNGIRLPKVVRIKTLACKAFGVLFSVAGGLPCGKEGPMIHSGAALGAGIPEGLSRLLKKMGYTESFFGVHDDRVKRDFISAGAAAGVSAAFGAPLGGVLFSLEEGSSFWNQALTWKTLFCSMWSAFTLQILKSAVETNSAKISTKYSGLINFGEFKCLDGSNECMLWGPYDLIVFVIMGAIGGLLGALFNQLNLYLTKYRFKHVNPKGRFARVVEVALVGITISALSYTLVNVAGHCMHWDVDSMDSELGNLTERWFCPQSSDLYNDYATIAYKPQEESIKLLFHHFNFNLTGQSEDIPLHPTYSPLTLVVFFIFLFLATNWTYGIAVPSGLFVPCLLIGATYGRIFSYCYQQIFKLTSSSYFYPGSYALIGAAAFLGGVVRMTISLTVIMIETTRNISYGLPIMLTLMVAKWVGDRFNKGLYDIHIDLKRWPLLEWEAEPLWETLRASDIMRSRLEWFPAKPSVGKIVDILKRTKHSAFPICTFSDSSSQGKTVRRLSTRTKSQLKLQGLILRSQIVTLLKKEQFTDNDIVPFLTYSELTEFYPKYPDIEDITLTVSDQNKRIDCTRYMNPCPYTVSVHAPITKVFTLFRSLGLRHLIVVNNSGEVEGIITRAELLEHHIDMVYKTKIERTATLTAANESLLDLHRGPDQQYNTIHGGSSDDLEYVSEFSGLTPPSTEHLPVPGGTQTLRTF